MKLLAIACFVVFSLALPSDIFAAKPSSHGVHKGDLTWYSLCPGCPSGQAGYTACGKPYTDTDLVVAISKFWFGTGKNPNNDPVCLHPTHVQITSPINGKKHTFPVVDKCCGCSPNDVDMSPAAFKSLGLDQNVGRYHKVKWTFTKFFPTYNSAGNFCPQTGMSMNGNWIEQNAAALKAISNFKGHKKVHHGGISKKHKNNTA